VSEPGGAALGVVIPTLNEARDLPSLLQDLHRLGVPTEIVVADGGSRDETAAVAARHGARAVTVPRGRASQMNAGAAAAQAPWLCFLHADVRMPAPARRELERVVEQNRAQAAVWSLAIDAVGMWPRVMEWGARVRDRLGGLPYGDQGLLVRRDLFAALGGYPAIPVMEDVALIRALRRRARVDRLRAPLVVSPRRWQREGPYRTWLRNSLLIGAYLAGAHPRRLARWYRPEAS
jgi:rSAM/selenodomain-associated transferase 2